jgi:hypothetical protein
MTMHILPLVLVVTPSPVPLAVCGLYMMCCLCYLVMPSYTARCTQQGTTLLCTDGMAI